MLIYYTLDQHKPLLWLLNNRKTVLSPRALTMNFSDKITVQNHKNALHKSILRKKEKKSKQTPNWKYASELVRKQAFQLLNSTFIICMYYNTVCCGLFQKIY